MTLSKQIEEVIVTTCRFHQIPISEREAAALAVEIAKGFPTRPETVAQKQELLNIIKDELLKATGVTRLH